MLYNTAIMPVGVLYNNAHHGSGTSDVSKLRRTFDSSSQSHGSSRGTSQITHAREVTGTAISSDSTSIVRRIHSEALLNADGYCCANPAPPSDRRPDFSQG